MILGLCENVCRPLTGRFVPQIFTFCVLTDQFKRKMHSSEKMSLISTQEYLHVGFGNDAQNNSFFLVCVANSVEILHLVRVQK